MGQLFYDLWVRGEFTLFVGLWSWIALQMTPRQLLAWWFYRAHERGRLFMQYDLKKHSVTVLVTVYREPPGVLQEALQGLKRSLEKGAAQYSIIVMIDGYDVFREEGDVLAQIAHECGAHLVLVTNNRSKRRNLRDMVKEARKRNLLYGFIGFMDSDTILDHDDVIVELLRPFSDERIGGVTTAQRCLSVATRAERVSDWLEHARLLSSMAAGSLFGQVGCLPGRLYMVRTHIVEPWMDALVEDYWRVPRLTWRWPFLGWKTVQCFAGDDRMISMRVLSEGYQTVLAPRASVKTVMPTTIWVLLKTWLRWGRSSQWYSIISMQYRWFWRNWFVAWHYLGDISITLITVFLVMRWGYLTVFGSGESDWSFYALVGVAVVGMFLTFIMRQIWHLYHHPRDLWFLPVFVLVVTAGQFVRLMSLLTPGSIGKWGTRSGVDADTKEFWYREHDKDG